ncbi:MAG: hypothetical protein ACREV0_07580 [Burkholderiales bacterium]
MPEPLNEQVVQLWLQVTRVYFSQALPAPQRRARERGQRSDYARAPRTPPFVTSWYRWL